MAFCQNCGVQLNEGTKFCPNCGSLVKTVEETGAASVQQEIQPAPTSTPVAEPVQAAPAGVTVMEKEDVPSASPQEYAAPQQPAYQQQPQQPAYQQQPQQPAYQQQPQQPAYQQQPQQPAYQQQPQQPAYQQQPQQSAYQQPSQQPAYQQPYNQSQTPATQSIYQQTGLGGTLTDTQMKKGMAVLAYFGILVLIPMFAAKQDPFARYHANQGLVLFILTMISSVLSNVLTSILIEISPVLTLVVSGLFGILTLIFCIFALVGIIHAVKGQTKPLPLIGGIKLLK